MAASRNDMYILGTNATPFQNRVQSSLLSTCIAIQSENASSTVFHRERSGYVTQITSSVSNLNDAVQRHAFACATDANVISDATQAGTVVLTGANINTQAALVTDAHIDTAISGQFNTFFRTPGF